MKKATSVLLPLLLLALLAACGGPAPAEESAAPAPAAVPSPEPTPAPTEKPFTRGVIEGQTYSSGLLGLRFTAPEGWSFADDEALAQRMGLSLDIIGDDVFGDKAELAKAIAQQAVIHDMAAFAPDNSANVQLTVEDLEATGGAALTTEEYAELLRQQLLSVTDLNYEPEEAEQSALAGRPCVALLVHLRDYGMEQRFYLLREGKYMISVVLTGAEGALPDAETFFSAY